MGVIWEHWQVPHCHQYNPSLEKALVLRPHSLARSQWPLVSSVVHLCQPLGSFSTYRTNSFENYINSFVSCWRVPNSLFELAHPRCVVTPWLAALPHSRRLTSAALQRHWQLDWTEPTAVEWLGFVCFFGPSAYRHHKFGDAIVLAAICSSPLTVCVAKL